ncbi:MAG: hypothetical protein ACREGF_04160 [Candidatus Saccharimonadales bacterium]
MVEVKDGDQFDTKKAGGEYQTLHNFTNDISQELAFSMRIFMCSFNSPDVEAVYHGLKRKFNRTELLTGKGLCALFDIDYDEIIKIRTSDQQTNLEYFIEQLVAIPSIRSMVIKALSKSKV